MDWGEELRNKDSVAAGVETWGQESYQQASVSETLGLWGRLLLWHRPESSWQASHFTKTTWGAPEEMTIKAPSRKTSKVERE